MPRVCEKCGYYSATDDPKPGCPACGRRLKFTLLPPPGAEPDPVPGVPTVLTNRYGNNPELADAEYATGPTILSGYVSSKYGGLLVLFGVVILVLFVLTLVTNR